MLSNKGLLFQKQVEPLFKELVIYLDTAFDSLDYKKRYTDPTFL